ncbi:hypothetical protein AQF52_0545 [Streptomyces venezuelae]|uniref:hypothetical protein n=1 Tax=Streptomyces gardneri TaxID=66892 RepID=UPI0006BD8771|nr:hypothetical protein [Streptomyces gardneri]ALO06142.1 hypothetical protein AQF52_0545 [Streptomyces venezuelae]QPK43619.1 hypothetical protein H4W23_02625 [Streptomyces gardneri]WRK34868.1 hypothetical protein U0M97_02640 [Streptomyces venezuelae]CUM43616.1 Cytoplasmic membrane protein FsxA [Streptomyces venezuelae]
MDKGGERGGSSVPDEAWEEFLRSAADGAGDAPTEPSARAREVAGRLGTEPVEPTPWRAHTPARPRRKKGWYVAGFVASLALLVVAVDPGGIVGWSDGKGPAGEPLAQESQRPSEAPADEPGGRATLADPFRGSPAARWANGKAGITVPAARATGWMTEAEVRQALARTRDFLAASNLDRTVLRGGRPEKAITLMNPEQESARTFVSTALSAPDEDNDPLVLFSRFDPGQARLVGDVVKTRGRITFREGKRGALEVTADVTYVYPVAPAGGGDEVVRTIVRRETVVSWDDPEKVITKAGTFSLLSYKTDMTNGGCGETNGFFRPVFGGGSDSGTDEDRRVDPYDRSKAMEKAHGGCGTATRS